MPTLLPAVRPIRHQSATAALCRRVRNPLQKVLSQERTCTCTAHVPRGRTRQPAAGAPAHTPNNSTMSHNATKPLPSKAEPAAHCAYLCLERRSGAAGHRPAAHRKAGKNMEQYKLPDKRPALCHEPVARTCAVQLPRSMAATMTAGLCAALAKQLSIPLSCGVRLLSDYVSMAVHSQRPGQDPGEELNLTLQI